MIDADAIVEQAMGGMPQLVAHCPFVIRDGRQADEVGLAFAEGGWTARAGLVREEGIVELVARHDAPAASPHAVISALHEVLWRWRGELVVQRVPLGRFYLVDECGAWSGLAATLTAIDPDGHLARAWGRGDRAATLSAVRRLQRLLAQRPAPITSLADTLFA